MNVSKERARTNRPLLSAILLITLAFSAPQLLFGANEGSNAVRRFGLFVGANDGGPERAKLKWAVSDSERMNQVMTELGGMFSQDTVILAEPKAAELKSTFALLKDQIKKAQTDSRRVEFMFYYSGHSDEDGLLLGKDRIAYKGLRNAITELSADVSIAVLDSCSSGAFTRTKGGVRVQPFLVDNSSDMKGYAFLTSASENEAAQESDKLGASFFTYYLVSALRGAAATTGNARVTLNQAYNYAFTETLSRTESTTNGPQHPSYDINLSGSGDLVLSDLSQPSASLVLQDDLEGRVSVRDQKGFLVMEINKFSGKSLLIALPPGSYSLRFETKRGVFAASARLIYRQKATIGSTDFQSAPLTNNRIRGNDAELDVRSETDGVLEQAREQYRNRNAKESNTPDASAEAGIGGWELVDQPGDTEQLFLVNSEFHVSLVPGLSFATRVGFTSRDAELLTYVSLSPFMCLVGKNDGIMLSGLLNVNGGPERGAQFAGLGNISTSTLEGYQSAGLFNISSSSVTGVQSAGLFNFANSLQGVQLAGLVNIVGDAQGVLIAPINIAGSLDGVALGLINIVLDGIHDVSTWVTVGDRFFVGILNGSKTFYSVLFTGKRVSAPIGDLDGLLIGYGIGTRIKIGGPVYLDVSIDAKRPAIGSSNHEIGATLFNITEEESQIFDGVRLVPGMKVVAGFELAFIKGFLGLNLDLFAPGLASATQYYGSTPAHPWVLSEGQSPVLLNPSFILGVSVSF